MKPALTPISFKKQALLFWPAALMTLLALGSWWLVYSTRPIAAKPEQAAVPQHVEDEMWDFGSQVFDAQGQLQQTLRGDRFEHDNTGEMRVYRASLLNRNGAEETTANAAQIESDAQGERTNLRGQVRLTRQEAGKLLVLEGEHVVLTQKGQQIESPQAVRIWQEGMQLQGQSLRYHAGEGVLHMQGGVRAQLQPR